GGAMADRLDRRRWLLLTTVGETVFAALLALLAAAGHPSPGAVTLLVFFGGAMASVGFPAYQAMLPDLVESEDLLAAISLSSAQLASPFIGLIPAIALKLFDEKERGTSILVTAQGVGAVAGALALAPLAHRFGRRRVLVLNLLVLPATLVLYGLAPSLAVATGALVLVGGA